MKGPLILLSDSQLLFTAASGVQYGQWFRDRLALQIKSRPASNDAKNNDDTGEYGVYIGASNGNEPAFYEMANSALSALGLQTLIFMKRGLDDLGEYRQQVPAVIVLAGGEVAPGWEFIGQPTVKDWLEECYRNGSAMLGVSAGAIHITHFLKFYSAYTVVHEEHENWPGFNDFQAQRQFNECFKIPFASGVWIDNSPDEGSGVKITTFGKTPSEKLLLSQLGTQEKLVYYP